MSERENILGRIREALRIAAPFPGEAHGPAHPSSAPHTPRSAAAHAREWLPRVGPGFDEQASLFRTQCDDLKAAFRLLAGEGELAAAVRALATEKGWKKVAWHNAPLSRAAAEATGLPGMEIREGYDVTELESCDAGITECDALVAQTGSVLVTSRSAGGRALSVLPPHHLVIARREQLLPDLPAAFELIASKYGATPPSLLSFITGPSRTGDIERILVLGAHGPKELTILCI